MNNIDRKSFFDGYRAAYGPLTQSQVDGLEALLGALETDDRISDPRHAAYMLATTKHETADTFRPIAEYGKGTGRKYGKPDPQTGKVYYGRGYVQLTWAENYQTMGQALGLDLYHNPDLAMDPATAYAIMSRGMRKGSFTGVKLATYIHDDACDYLHARKIINGMDCAERIAGYAAKLEQIITGAQHAAT